MLLSDCLNNFIKYQRLKGNSTSTINMYKIVINKFIDFKGNVDINLLSADDFNDYNLFLRDRVKMVSVRTYIRHLKVFLNYLVEEYHIFDFSKKVVMPSKPKNIIEILSSSEIDMLLSCEDTTTFLGLRNYCMLLLMLDCGLRASEVIHLLPNCIQFDFKGIKVIGKGSKERIVPMGDTVSSALLEYKSKYSYRINYYFFVGNYYDFITRDIFRDLFQRYRKITGISRLYPHLLRHTFATNFLLNGLGDIFELSMILGHSDVTTTQIYLHIANYYKFMQNKKNFSYLDSR